MNTLILALSLTIATPDSTAKDCDKSAYISQIQNATSCIELKLIYQDAQQFCPFIVEEIEPYFVEAERHICD